MHAIISGVIHKNPIRGAQNVCTPQDVWTKRARDLDHPPHMKFSVAKDKLLEGLQTVQNVVGSRTTLPILSNVLIRAEEGVLRLTTNDLDVGICCEVSAQVERGGGTTLPVRRLSSIVKELPAADVMVEVDGKNVATIRCGQTLFKMNGLAEEEFPALPRLADAKVFTFKQKEMKD